MLAVTLAVPLSDRLEVVLDLLGVLVDVAVYELVGFLRHWQRMALVVLVQLEGDLPRQEVSRHDRRHDGPRLRRGTSAT